MEATNLNQIDTVLTSFRIPRGLHKRIKALACELEMPMSELVCDALEDYVHMCEMGRGAKEE